MQPAELFLHCPRCGRAQTRQGAESPFRCQSCGFTYYFSAAIAAVCFVQRQDGRMLFVRRAKDPAKGLLAPPGGFVDIGERAEEAVRREVREEIGLEITTPEFLGSFPNTYHYLGVTYPVLDLFFIASAINPALAQPLEDVESFCWRDPIGEITPDELAFPSMRAALQALRERIRNTRQPTT